MNANKILIAGRWQDSNSTGSFQAENPRTATLLPGHFPISGWSDVDAALDAATIAFQQMQTLPRETIAKFLDSYANRIDARSAEICALAALETALPANYREPRINCDRQRRQPGNKAGVAPPSILKTTFVPASAPWVQSWCLVPTIFRWHTMESVGEILRRQLPQGTP